MLKEEASRQAFNLRPNYLLLFFFKECMDIPTEARLYKADVPRMPLLYYIVTEAGIICWTQGEGWITTDWNPDLIELTNWVEKLQGGKFIKSNKLQFLLDSGMGLKRSLYGGIGGCLEDAMDVRTVIERDLIYKQR
jgi:hypothetical protein